LGDWGIKIGFLMS